MSHYPFDNQTCQIVFEQCTYFSSGVCYLFLLYNCVFYFSVGYRKFEVQYKLPNTVRPLVFSPLCSYPTRFKLLEKRIVFTPSSRKYNYYYNYCNMSSSSSSSSEPSKVVDDCLIDSTSILEIKFPFVRNAEPIIIQSHLPACLIVIISWLGFYVNRDSRFGLGVSLVLALSALSFSSGRTQNLGSITGTDIYRFACFLFVFFSLVEYGVVQFLGNRHRSRQRENQAKEVSLFRCKT